MEFGKADPTGSSCPAEMVNGLVTSVAVPPGGVRVTFVTVKPAGMLTVSVTVGADARVFPTLETVTRYLAWKVPSALMEAAGDPVDPGGATDPSGLITDFST